MKKYILVATLPLFIMCSSTTEKPKNNVEEVTVKDTVQMGVAKNSWAEMNLKGRVKQLKEINYALLSEGDLNGPFKKQGVKNSSVYIFNEKGYRTEWNNYNSDGTLYGKTTYKYNDQGNVIEVAMYNADGSLSYKNTFKDKYDDKGNKIEANRYNADGSLNNKTTFKYKFDDKGTIIEKSYFNADGSLGSKHTFKYEFNDKGSYEVEEIVFGADGNRFDYNSYKDYKFDTNFNWTSRMTFGFNRTPIVSEREIIYY
jgi:hypothetical protein